MFCILWFVRALSRLESYDLKSLLEFISMSSKRAEALGTTKEGATWSWLRSFLMDEYLVSKWFSGWY